MNIKLAELIGIMAGDGCLSRSKRSRLIYICGHKEDDLKHHTFTTKRLFKEVFNKKIKIDFRKKENALFIKFSDKEIFLKLAKYLPIGKKYGSLKVPPEILKEKVFFFAFVRGLADTDGCVVFSKQHRQVGYYPRVEITSKSKRFLESILIELKKYHFYGSVSHKGKKVYRLEIPGNKNLKLWLKDIKFSNSKHLKKIEGRRNDLLSAPGAI